MSLKGANSPTSGRKLRSTGTKAKGVARSDEPQASLIKRLKAHARDLEKKLEARTRELGEARDHLAEALEPHTATAEVLQVITTSFGDLESVFDAILANATRLCEAGFGTLWLCEGEGFRAVALHNAPSAYVRQREREPVIRPSPASGLGRAAITKQVVQIADAMAGRAYREGDPLAVGAVELAGTRTFVSVPMLKEGDLVGVFNIYRQEVRPFTDKQIALLTNFAAQAVIAIENARLLNELRESLQQQTATSEVLQVISSSPGELQPVFQAMLANATRLCEASYGALWLCEGDTFRGAAFHGDLPPAYIEQYGTSFRPSPETALARVARTHKPVNIADTYAHPAYLHGNPLAVAGVKVAGIRTFFAVPMLKENELIGVIAIYRMELRPFSDKQIELVTSFANQAVIAIENARLLKELRQRTDDLSESLEQQTATSEVLGVISRSPGQLEPVFQAMLENAVRICEAKFGALYLSEGDAVRMMATSGVSRQLDEELRSAGLRRPGPRTALGRVIATKHTAHVADAFNEAGFFDVKPGFSAPQLSLLAGARTLVAVPLLKEGALVGAIVIYRQEVRPFTNKQIELLQNFAAQAVIAIENTRLLNELRDSLQQQTATADVLQVF